MPLPKENNYTTKDIYELPDGQRAELIDGTIYDMAPPSRLHQKISTRLVSVIDRYISDNNGKCEVYSAPFAVFLNKDDKTIISLAFCESVRICLKKRFSHFRRN